MPTECINPPCVARFTRPRKANCFAFLGPYTGPTYAGGTPVDAGTMKGKLLCGYQGWFRAPGDADDTGWQHYIPDWGGAISPAKI